MQLSLFDHENFANWKAVDTPSEYGHRIGGTGFRFPEIPEPLQVLATLDSTDPCVPLSLPKSRLIPLCFGFRYTYRVYEFSYRVDGDYIFMDSPEQFSKPNDDDLGVDSEISQSAASFEHVAFDPSSAEDALRLGGMFGFDHLTKQEMDRAISIEANRYNNLFDEWRSGGGVPGRDFPDWTNEELLRNEYKEPYWQTRPYGVCLNPTCGNDNPRLKTFAICEIRSLQVIFRICNICSSINVSNQAH